MPPTLRDRPLMAVGVALFYVGLAEVAVSFLYPHDCESWSNGVCSVQAITGPGFGLLEAGIVVSVVGGALYLLGRRPVRD